LGNHRFDVGVDYGHGLTPERWISNGWQEPNGVGPAWFLQKIQLESLLFDESDAVAKALEAV
jgi:hypothetical protein